jgi:hypothetical protein
MMSLGLLLLDHQVHGQTNQTESVGSIGRLTGEQAQNLSPEVELPGGDRMERPNSLGRRVMRLAASAR